MYLELGLDIPDTFIVTDVETLSKRRMTEMADWHTEIHEELGWFTGGKVKNALFEGHQIDSNHCNKCDTSGHWQTEPEHGKIEAHEPVKMEAYESKNYSLGCRICGSLTGEHGFSFDSERIE